MKKRWILLLAALLAAMLAFAACGNNDGDAAEEGDTPPAQPAQAGWVPEWPDGHRPAVVPTQTTKTHLEIVTTGLPVAKNAIGSNDSASAEFSRLVYQTLFRLDYDTGEPMNELATGYEFIDAQTIRIFVREGVTFHNGDPLTAHDVAFSLTRAGASEEMAILFGMIDRAEAVSDTEVILYLEFAFAPIILHLAHNGGAIVPMNHINAVGEDHFRDNPIGSGAFEFVRMIDGDRIEYRRFENYSGNMPVIETITMRLVPEASVRVVEVSTGTADVALGVMPADINVATNDPNVNLLRRRTMGIDLIWFNAIENHPRRPGGENPLANPLVRQAINYAFDTEAAISLVFLGAGGVLHTVLPEGVFGFVEQPPFETNIERARELLAEAGYADGFDAEIWWNSPNATRQQIAEMMQAALQPLNINLTIVTLEWGEYLDRSAAAEHDMLILGWSTVTGDADYGLHPLFHSANFGAAGNRSFFKSEELDALLDAGRTETDTARRLQIYADALAYLRQNAPVVMLRQGEMMVAVSPSLRNITLNPVQAHNWGTVFFE